MSDLKEKCSICLEKKYKKLNTNFKCTCSIFICNKCTNVLLNYDSIYSNCPQCRSDKIIILHNKSINKCKKIYNSDIYYLIINIISAIILWLIFLNIVGYFMLSHINNNSIQIHTENMNLITLYLIIQPLIGLITFLIYGIIMYLYFLIICKL